MSTAVLIEDPEVVFAFGGLAGVEIRSSSYFGWDETDSPAVRVY
jgi:hypothetical protein